MTVEIYRALPRMEWAPSTPQYLFRPESDGHLPHALVEVPEGWMLVGEPEPLLVHRLNASDFRTMSAVDVFYYAVSRIDGFGIVSAPPDGVASELGAKVVARTLGTDPRPGIDAPRKRGLPRPESNGSR